MMTHFTLTPAHEGDGRIRVLCHKVDRSIRGLRENGEVGELIPLEKEEGGGGGGGTT